MSESQKPHGGARPPDDLPVIDVSERAGERTGNPQVLHSRLYMQLLVFECEGTLTPSAAVARLQTVLAARGVSAVVYADVNHPRGLGLVTWSETPAHFVVALRPAIEEAGLSELRVRPEFSMLGRTYATGYETDLQFWLLDRPKQTIQNTEWPWAVWYPLRRIGAFARLPGQELGAIMAEHGKIGRAYGAQDLAHDIRLACYGIDQSDNEFVIGLLGKDLTPLSKVVESMRRTRQTSEFMQHMGPFFVGHVIARIG